MLLGGLLFVGIEQQSVEPLPPTPAPEIMVITAVPTPATPTYEGCAWSWANEDQPDLTARLGAALEAQQIAYTQLRVYAFGENCGDASGSVAYFAAMETDFELTLTAASVSDREALGNTAAAVLAIIVTDFPADSTPGPMDGRIQITFSDGTQSWSALVRQNWAAALLDQGLNGATLITALEQAAG
jgi:hypothetical protein